MHGADAVFKIYQEHCTMCTCHFHCLQKRVPVPCFFLLASPILHTERSVSQQQRSKWSGAGPPRALGARPRPQQEKKGGGLQLNCSQERMRPGRSIEQGIVCSADNVQQLRIWVLCMQCALAQCALVQCSVCTLTILLQIKSFQGQLNWHWSGSGSCLLVGIKYFQRIEYLSKAMSQER